MIEYAVCAGLVVGTFFVAVSALGLLRLPDVYSRMHAVTKATTIGLAGMLAASALDGWSDGRGFLAEALTIWFVFLTNPVGGHMIARSAYLTGTPLTKDSVLDQLAEAGARPSIDHDVS